MNYVIEAGSFGAEGASRTAEGQPQVVAVAEGRRYRCDYINRFPVGGNSELVYSPATRAARVLPAEAAALLENCRTFKSLDDHALDHLHALKQNQARTDAALTELSERVLPSFVAKLLGSMRGYAQQHQLKQDSESALVSGVKAQLEEFVRAGLLVTESDLTGATRGARPSPAKHTQPARVSSVGVVTRDRPESLMRCLSSYIENGIAYGRSHDYVVMDDSESADTRRATREALRTLKARYGVEILYGGVEEKRKFAAALATEGDLEPELVNNALFDVEGCGCSIGANRNALLLHTAGELFFSTDDDTVCRLAPSPETEDGLAFFSGALPAEFHFFPDRETALKQVQPAATDFLAPHEEMLGKTLRQCLDTIGGPRVGLDSTHSHSRFFQNSQLDEGRVLATFNGIVGDSGMNSPRGYFFLDDDSRARYLGTEDAYRSANVSREVLRTVTRPTIADNGWSVTTALCFDNRELLPPFMPVQRNEDGIFGLTLRSCFKDGFFGHLPWAVLHAPAESRSYTSEATRRFATGCRLSDIMQACLRSFEVWPGLLDGSERLRVLGRHLVSIGSMSPEDFEEFIRVHWWHAQSMNITMLQGLLEKQCESPAYWAADVRNYIDTVTASLTRSDYVVPFDLLEGRTAVETRELTRRLVLRFGRLLGAWPDIVAAAKRLKGGGQRLAQNL